MRIIADTIPEYKVLRSMAGVGDRLGPIILGEIGDIRRFHSGKALNAYAGNDAPPYQSGQFESRNRHISKRGNPALRKACFEVMQALKLTKPQDDPVYLFLLKKEQEGKPYNVAKKWLPSISFCGSTTLVQWSCTSKSVRFHYSQLTAGLQQQVLLRLLSFLFSGFSKSSKICLTNISKIYQLIYPIINIRKYKSNFSCFRSIIRYICTCTVIWSRIP